MLNLDRHERRSGTGLRQPRVPLLLLILLLCPA